MVGGDLPGQSPPFGDHRQVAITLCGRIEFVTGHGCRARRRTNDGRVAAKARGVAFGRPKKMRPDQQQLARELVRDGKSISAVARIFDVHPATIYRVIEG